jgi:hypothetical protein
MEQKCYVLRKTQTSVGYRTEPSRSSVRFYIGALCNSAIKLAAPKRPSLQFVRRPFALSLVLIFALHYRNSSQSLSRRNKENQAS